MKKNVMKNVAGIVVMAVGVMIGALLIPSSARAMDISYIDIQDPGPYSGVGHLHMMSDGNVFDQNYYAWAHPEVAYAVGGTPEALYQHYLTVGRSAGWLPYVSNYDNVPAPVPMQGYWAEKQLLAFSALVNNGYILENSKVAYPDREWMLIYCADYDGYRASINSKIYVDESALFDANYYALMNPDIAALYGTDKAALWNHYKTIGVYEGRPAAGITDEANAKILAAQVAASIITPDMTDVQKVIAIHDWMVGYAHYDLSCGLNCRKIQGFMFERTGVCHGYAVTFEYFMTLLDIPCNVVLGESGGYHSWNSVFVNGQWLYVDVTKDDPVNSVMDLYSNSYLLKTGDQMLYHTVWRTEDYF